MAKNRGVQISELEKNPGEENADLQEKEVKAARAAKSKAKRTKDKGSLLLILNYVKENSKDKEILAAVAAITPGQHISGTKAGIKDIIAEAFIENSKINENDIWKEYKLGRTEMRRICINLIKKEAPEDRMWISFDPETEMYILDGTGSDAPDDWTGYQPVDMEDIEI